MIVVRRKLKRDLSRRGEQVREPREELLVIRNPMERGIREHQIERTFADERLDVALLEAQHLPFEVPALQQHRLRVVDADRLGRAEGLVQLAREVTRAASEVRDAHAWTLFDQ